MWVFHPYLEASLDWMYPPRKERGYPVFKDFASYLGLVLVTPPTRQVEFQPKQNERFKFPKQVQFYYHIDSFTLIPLISRNLENWKFINNWWNLVHITPKSNNNVEIWYCAVPLKTEFGLKLVPYPSTILAISLTSILDYRACQGPQDNRLKSPC